MNIKQTPQKAFTIGIQSLRFFLSYLSMVEGTGLFQLTEFMKECQDDWT
jgi:hypothetical protein